MNRRQFFHACQPVLIAALAGCDGEYVGNDQLAQIVRVRPPELHEADDACELRVEIQLALQSGEPIEVELLAYADDGSLVCSEDVGSLNSSKRWNEIVETECAEPPTIVTAATDPSVCDDVAVELRYWVDEASSDEKTRSGWHEADRACEESLPPERFLDRSVEPPPCVRREE